MLIKIIDGKASPCIGGTIVYNQKPTYVEKEYKEEVKRQIEEGREIVIKEDDKWIDAKDYFNNDLKKTTVTADIKNVEDYGDLFQGHWKKQVKYIKDNYSDPNILEDILEYARKNASEAVVSRLEDYLEELRK